MAARRRPVHDERRGDGVDPVVPPLVARSRAEARRLDFDRCSTDEVGRLLHVLAGGRGVERVAEIGTGVGTGTAWLAAALAPGTPLYTAEADDALADAAKALFAGDPDVLVLRGDWRAVLPPHAPFDLVFADGGRAKDDPDAVLGLAAPGATVVLDDFSADWPRPDERRERWLAHPRVTAVELGTGQDRTAIVAVVRR